MFRWVCDPRPTETAGTRCPIILRDCWSAFRSACGLVAARRRPAIAKDSWDSKRPHVLWMPATTQRTAFGFHRRACGDPTADCPQVDSLLIDCSSRVLIACVRFIVRCLSTFHYSLPRIVSLVPSFRVSNTSPSTMSFRVKFHGRSACRPTPALYRRTVGGGGCSLVATSGNSRPSI